MPLLTSVSYIINRRAQRAHNTTLKNAPAEFKHTHTHFKRLALAFRCLGPLSEMTKLCCGTAKKFAATALIVVIPPIVQQQSSQHPSFPPSGRQCTALPISSDNVPTCTFSCKAPPCSPARPRIYFLINIPLWVSAPCLMVIYLRPSRCLIRLLPH